MNTDFSKYWVWFYFNELSQGIALSALPNHLFSKINPKTTWDPWDCEKLKRWWTANINFSKWQSIEFGSIASSSVCAQPSVISKNKPKIRLSKKRAKTLFVYSLECEARLKRPKKLKWKGNLGSLVVLATQWWFSNIYGLHPGYFRCSLKDYEACEQSECVDL